MIYSLRPFHCRAPCGRSGVEKLSTNVDHELLRGSAVRLALRIHRGRSRDLRRGRPRMRFQSRREQLTCRVSRRQQSSTGGFSSKVSRNKTCSGPTRTLHASAHRRRMLSLANEPVAPKGLKLLAQPKGSQNLTSKSVCLGIDLPPRVSLAERGWPVTGRFDIS
jgi:hypothetical protein